MYLFVCIQSYLMCPCLEQVATVSGLRKVMSYIKTYLMCPCLEQVATVSGLRKVKSEIQTGTLKSFNYSNIDTTAFICKQVLR